MKQKEKVVQKAWYQRPIIVLGFILVAASFLRLYHLNTNPPSMYWDENSLGYDAYSILKTGKDHHGNPYPIIAFPSFGDYKPSGYIYAIVPFIKLVGLNTWAVRLPSALAGTMSVAVLFYIGRELWNEHVGLIAAGLLAIQPWAIQFSRGGWEANFALMLTLVGTLLLLLSRRKIWMLPFAVLFFALSMYTYHAERLFSPVMGALGGVLLCYEWFWRQRNMKQSSLRWKRLLAVIISGLLAIGLIAPLLLNVQNVAVASRFTDTTIFSDIGPILASNKAIAAHGNTRLARIMYHRYFFFLPIIFNGWIAHFSPLFLFWRGDGNLRHSVAMYGLVYPVEAVFIGVALLSIIDWKRRRIQPKNVPIFFLILWIAFAAVPAALVTPTPHTLRFLIASPAFALLSAVGIYILTKRKGFPFVQLRRVLIALSVFVCFAFYIRYYYTTYPIKASGDWQYGYVQLYQELAKLKQPGEHVYVTREEGRPSMYYLFDTAYDPATIQREGQSIPKDQLELLQVDDYYFIDKIPDVKGLFASSPAKVSPGAQILDTIHRLDGSTVWVIWRKE